MATWVILKVFPNRIQAELARALLEEHDIPAAVQADDTSGLYPQLALVSGVQLQVEESYVQHARKLLEEEFNP